MPTYPPLLPIEPLAHPPDCSIVPPGSKSLTNRALPLAALCARRPVVLRGWLDCDDTRVMIDSLRRLGHRIDEGTDLVVQSGTPPDRADLFVGNSGTTMRFLTALAAVGGGTVRLDGVPRMRQRPIGDLLQALEALGVEASAEAGFPPVTVRGGGWRGGEVCLRGDVSSQFLSGLLMAAPFAPAPAAFRIDGPLVSRPYVDMTLGMMRQFGLRAEEPVPGTFRVPAPQQGRLAGDACAIEPDASAASYFFAAAAIAGGTVRVPGLPIGSLQGDVRFLDALEAMGCRVERGPGPLAVHGGPLRGVDLGMNAISDTVMTLAVVALFAEGPTRIRDVAHIRHKETDRLAALAAELRRLGAGVVEYPDGLAIEPRPLHGATVRTYDDHRMAMSLALAGLRVPGVVVADPGCVAKTYPGYFADLRSLYRGTP